MDSTVLSFNIEVELHGVTMASVSLDGSKAGYATYESRYRAPKKWAARRNNAEEIGRFASATEAAFAIALHAHNSRTRDRILTKLSSDAPVGTGYQVRNYGVPGEA